MGQGRVLLIFLDGVGIGPDDPKRNPFLSARLPTLRSLLGRLPTLADPAPRTDAAAVLPLDATLGFDGRPQSGTGQTTLLTGLNAVRMFGRHFGPWTPVRLRPVLAETNILRKAARAGLRVAFANAYPKGYPDGVKTRRVAAPPLAALSAQALTRHAEHLRGGTAIASDILNRRWKRHFGHSDLPDISAEEAGHNLAMIAAKADLTLFAHYATDHAGHHGGLSEGAAALERVDSMLAGVLSSVDDETLVVIASDHGNIEDATGKHTRNPVMGVFIRGAGLGTLPEGRLKSIQDVAPYLLERLGAGGAPDPDRIGVMEPG